MKKFAVYSVVLVIISFFSTSCNDKDEDNGPKIGFATTSTTVTEGDYAHIKFSIPLPEGITPKFTFGGTAQENFDYLFSSLSSDRTELIVKTKADNVFETESIEIELTSFSGGGSVGQVKTHSIKIEDPSLYIKLVWDGSDVNMNLVLWKLNAEGTAFDFVKAATSGSGNEEYLTLPVSSSDAIYGLTYQYFSGSAETVEFTVFMETGAGTIEGSQQEESFSGTYTLNNKNNSYYVDIEQLFIKEDSDYNSFTDIFIPDYGSRLKNLPALTGLRIP